MARTPNKVARFLVWSSASGENADDALIAYEERYERVYDKFGPRYAKWWSFSQAARSLPYGIIAAVFKIVSIVLKISK